MTLFEQWEALINNQTDSTFPDFWEKYSSTEKSIYIKILDNASGKVSGIFKDLVSEYNADPIIFMGFLDGINASLNNEHDFKSFDENSEVFLDIDFEKLFHNMLIADADYLYTLPQWNDILSEETRESIITSYKRSKTIVKEKQPGRNDPCPCGSGKKYKKCCGASPL